MKLSPQNIAGPERRDGNRSDSCMPCELMGAWAQGIQLPTPPAPVVQEHWNAPSHCRATTTHLLHGYQAPIPAHAMGTAGAPPGACLGPAWLAHHAVGLCRAGSRQVRIGARAGPGVCRVKLLPLWRSVIEYYVASICKGSGGSTGSEVASLRQESRAGGAATQQCALPAGPIVPARSLCAPVAPRHCHLPPCAAHSLPCALAAHSEQREVPPAAPMG